MSERERAVAFLRETYRRRVERVERYEWGELVVSPSLPLVYDGNFAIVDRWPGNAVDLAVEMDDVQGEHGFAHRKVVIFDESLAGRLWPELTAPAWAFRSRYLVMAHTRPPERHTDPAIAVATLADADWARAKTAEAHGSDSELVRQLLELDRALARALDARRVGAIVDGAVGSYASLYLANDVAQIEDVATHPAYRGRGLARAVVLHALDEARAAGARLVFLVADEHDWPKELYCRLGFDTIGVEHVTGRPAGNRS